jgi:hypothetical protein
MPMCGDGCSWVQGGDIFRGKGDAGQSIYGEPFADECFSLPLDDKPGVLVRTLYTRVTPLHVYSTYSVD